MEDSDPSELISSALSGMDNFDKVHEALVILKSIGWINDYDDDRVDSQILNHYSDHPKAGECSSWSQLYSEIDDDMQEIFLQNVGNAYLNR